MSREEELRLQDIRDPIANVRAHIATQSFGRKTSDAVLYDLVVIGEAANQISEETRLAASEIVEQELDHLDETAQRLLESARGE